MALEVELRPPEGSKVLLPQGPLSVELRLSAGLKKVFFRGT